MMPVVLALVFAGTPVAEARPAAASLPDGWAVSAPERPRGALPLLVFLNGFTSTCGQQCQPLRDRLAALPYVVLWETGSHYTGDYVEWRDGSVHGEQRVLDAVRAAEQMYHVSSRRSDRVVAGISAGGYGAMLLAAHHPQEFGGAASFSGPLDVRGAGHEDEAVYMVAASDPGTDPRAVYGAPVVDDASWRDRNPADLVTRLGNTAVLHTSGSGVPCDEADSPLTVEWLVRKGNDRFQQLARSAGVAAEYRAAPCGVHSHRYFTPEVLAYLDGLSFPLATAGSAGGRKH
jgi:S-formylglutathione hydrolase FrmB